eukprot:gnl/MRDRNA2_/MRDRNA2_90168_c0_seq1.p1 gnl/MRDRNA2_/MRDRNA2_90168_c0~~gnl/MRDRNA2_/MRDRNA2_90168_c0_seq1.p1  ORF type:complete len:243 (-),score=45.24 gnl/MRDRNA2_/MRDRNA2_90168_c0_seq1:41-688(-)
MPVHVKCILLHLVALPLALAGKSLSWPAEDLGQRTSEKVSAGKRAAKWIACDVCKVRVAALFKEEIDEEQVGDVLENSLGEWLGDAKKLCDMKGLAQLFRGQKAEIVTHDDGSAEMKFKGQGEKAPFYEEINTSDLVFHWKSLALQHACMEVFRKSGDLVHEGIKAEYESLSQRKDVMQGTPFDRLMKATYKSCREAKFCKASDKLREKQQKSEL